jgi:hypothetical protein
MPEAIQSFSKPFKLAQPKGSFGSVQNVHEIKFGRAKSHQLRARTLADYDFLLVLRLG